MKIDINQLLDKSLEALLKHGAIDIKSKVDGFNTTINANMKNSLEKTNNSDLSKSVANKFITIKNDTVFMVSRLGKAAVKGLKHYFYKSYFSVGFLKTIYFSGGIDLQRAHLLYSDLIVAQKSFVIIGVLHLLYLVTPYDLAEIIKPNLLVYHSLV